MPSFYAYAAQNMISPLNYNMSFQGLPRMSAYGTYASRNFWSQI
jgi:hypothetical protein